MRLKNTLLVLLLCAAAAAFSAAFGYRSAVESQVAVASQGITSFTSALSSLLEQHETTPRLVALDPRVDEVLTHPTPATIATVNRYLESVAARGGLAAAYVIDTDGLTVAASNWNTPQTFVGHNYAFRPYFKAAMATGRGHFYGIGNVTSTPGLFISSSVVDAGRPRGVVVVKVDLQALQTSAYQNADSIALVDEYGVVFLSSNPDFLYRPIVPLTAAARAALEANRAYGGQALAPLQPQARTTDIPTYLDLAGGRDFRLVVRKLSVLGWRAVAFVDTTSSFHTAIAAAVGGACATALVASLMLLSGQRRRRAAEIDRSRDELHRSQQRLQAVADSLSVLVCFLDRGARYVFANAAFAHHYGQTPASLDGRLVSEVVSAEEWSAIQPWLARAFGGESVVFDVEHDDRGERRVFEMTCRPERSAQGAQVVGVHLMKQDVTGARRRLAELARSAQLDHLTQLLNRKGFDMHLAEVLGGLSGNAGVALLFIDLDDFKPVNDQHGHAAGDALLRAFGERLAGLSRASDIVARLGGDEFAVILPGLDLPAVAERLAAAIARAAATPFLIEDTGGAPAADASGVRVTASIGIAVAGVGVDAATLCRRADAALYAAKRQGKGNWSLDIADRATAGQLP